MNIFSFGIVAFLAVVLFAGLIYSMGVLKDVFDEVGLANEVNSGSDMYVNMSLASEQIWGNAYTSIQGLRLVAITYILGLGVSIILTGYLQRKNPMFFFLWILISLLAIWFSPPISNAYETLLDSGIFGGELENFTTAGFIILNLPIIVMVICFVGGILLFTNLVRSSNEGEIN